MYNNTMLQPKSYTTAVGERDYSGYPGLTAELLERGTAPSKYKVVFTNTTASTGSSFLYPNYSDAFSVAHPLQSNRSTSHTESSMQLLALWFLA